MRVIVENGTPHLQNLGDVAMLQVTASRIREVFPDVELFIPTDDPDLLRRLIPGAIPISRGSWGTVLLFPFPASLLPGSLRRSYWRWQRRVGAIALSRSMLPRTLIRGLNGSAKADAALRFFDTVNSADAIVCCGGGLVNDWFPANGFAILGTLELGQLFRKPTAMFGLGIGPVESPELRKKAAQVLRNLDALSVREGVRSHSLLESLGLARSNYSVTGDDAIELTHTESPIPNAFSIGVNVRFAPHAQLIPEVLPRLKRAVLEASDRLVAPLRPVPVMLKGKDDDLAGTTELLGTERFAEDRRLSFNNPMDLIEEIACCRIVVSGSYHSAVFALSLGIPTISLYSSQYYHDKHRGLHDQFGNRCKMLELNDPDLEKRLVEAIVELWEYPPDTGELRRLATGQVERSREVYSNFFEVMKKANSKFRVN